MDNNSILNKFNDIEINNNSRITTEDQTFCEDQEKQYKEFITFSDDYLLYLNYNSISNKFFNSSNLIIEMDKTRDYKKNQFILNIINHFRDEYKVTLKDDPIQKKYNTDITYNIIIDEIIEQLGGYTFKDKAEKEIKDTFKNCLEYNLKYNNIKLKKCKLTIEDFFQIDYWDVKYKKYTVGYNSDDKFYKLFKALSHFMFRANEMYFNTIYRTITQEQNEQVFTTHNLSHSGQGALSLKLYKNGKIDLEFSSVEYAQQFAKEYCGYIGGVN